MSTSPHHHHAVKTLAMALAITATALGFIFTGKSTAQSTTSATPAKTPAEAAKVYYHTLGTGNLADLEKLMSAKQLAEEHAQPPEIRKARRAAIEAAIPFKDVVKIEVLKVNLQDTRAWVDVRLHYKNGTTADFNCGFILEGGEWKTSDS